MGLDKVLSTSNSDLPDSVKLPVRSSADRRIIFCVCVALATIAVIVLVRPVKQQGIRESLFWYLKVYPLTKYQVVVAGDSRVLQGVDPASMKEALGGSIEIVNVGFRSASFVREYMDFARSRLRNGSKKVLLLGITANAFTPQSMTDNGFIEQQKLGASRPYQFPLWWVVLERKFQPFALREILGLVRGRTKPGNYETFHDNGWLEADVIPRNPEAAFALYRRRFIGNRVDQEAIAALITQVREVVDAGVATIAFEPPVPNEMQAIEDEHSGFVHGCFRFAFRLFQSSA